MTENEIQAFQQALNPYLTSKTVVVMDRPPNEIPTVLETQFDWLCREGFLTYASGNPIPRKRLVTTHIPAFALPAANKASWANTLHFQNSKSGYQLISLPKFLSTVALAADDAGIQLPWVHSKATVLSDSKLYMTGKKLHNYVDNYFHVDVLVKEGELLPKSIQNILRNSPYWHSSDTVRSMFTIPPTGDALIYIEGTDSLAEGSYGINRIRGAYLESGDSTVSVEQFCKILDPEGYYTTQDKPVFNADTISAQLANLDKYVQNGGKSVKVPRTLVKITRGERPRGSTVSGRTKAASIASGHLSHKAISG